MPVIPVNLAVEDELSDVVLRRILTYLNRGYAVGVTYGRTGFGYLRSTIRGWNRAARGRPFIVLTDLDTYPCPPALIQNWLDGPQSPNLLLRVAVREVESWLLADRENLSRYLRVPDAHMSAKPDQLNDPKRALIALATRSRSSHIRARIVPKHGSTAKQGPEYNAALSEFVRNHWDIAASEQNSPSLSRTMRQLRVFVPVWPKLP